VPARQEPPRNERSRNDEERNAERDDNWPSRVVESNPANVVEGGDYRCNDDSEESNRRAIVTL
jgi:hypothetical protein